MQIPPEITLKGVKTTPRIDKLIDRGIASLEQVCDYITSTRIAIEEAQGRHQTGNPYQMRIDIRIAGRPEIVVKRSSRASKRTAEEPVAAQPQSDAMDDTEPDMPQRARRKPMVRAGTREEPLVTLIRGTFGSARRELQKVVEKQHGEVKNAARQHASAVVEQIFPDEGYGFLRTALGEQAYFHKNSVLHSHWENLKVGTAVRYVPEVGEQGLQASTVELTG